MAVVDTAPDQTRQPTVPWPPRIALGLALLCLTSFVVSLVLPYYANDLHHRPPGESLYLHEMSGLWPYTSSLGWLVGLLAMFALLLGPFVAFFVLCSSAYGLWSARRTPRVRTVWLGALVVSGVAFGWLLTPLAGELFVWLLD